MRAGAAEDCEEPIVRTLLGVDDDGDGEMALEVAGHFKRYAPALPHLHEKGSGRTPRETARPHPAAPATK